MVLGGSLNESKGGQAVVNITKAENAELTKWKYRGVLFQLPDREARTAECPKLFQAWAMNGCCSFPLRQGAVFRRRI